MKTSALGWQLALFTLIRTVVSTAYRMVYPFLGVFRDGLGVPLDSLTYAVGLRSLVAGLLGPLLAAQGDLRGRKTGMLLGQLTFLAGMSAVVLWPSFPTFVLALILSALGKVTFDPTMQAYIADRVPYSRRSVFLTVTEFSWSGAFLLGMPLVGWIIAERGWISPFYLLGGVALLAMIIFYKSLPADPPQAAQRPNLLRELLASKPALAALGLTFFSCVANEFINLTFGIWLEERFALRLLALGATAAILGAAELSGEGLVAAFTDRLGKRRAIVLGLLVNCLAVIALPIAGGMNLLAAQVTLFLFYISFEFFIVSAIPLMTEVMPQARTTMMAGFFTSASVSRALASLLVPALFGWGFWFVVLAAVASNLLALAFVSRVRLAAEG
ncbi:MAG: MFS transporter [Anaerolineales bacterium]|nr:MFS transporter [Anaerolineales bacterium]